MTERERFEAWAEKNWYYIDEKENAFAIWQAALAAQTQPLPKEPVWGEPNKPPATPAPPAPPQGWSEQYTELIMAVESKYPGETRHQTALRYIRRAEDRATTTAATTNTIAAAPTQPESGK